MTETLKEDVKKRLECVARITGNDLLADAYKIITEQEREIERLKAENDANMKYIRMMGIQSHIKTSNEQVKQAKIDVLIEVKKCSQCYNYFPDGNYHRYVLVSDIDILIKEVQDDIN